MRYPLYLEMAVVLLPSTVLGQTWLYIDHLNPSDASSDGRVIVGDAVGGSARWTVEGGFQVFGTEAGFGVVNGAGAVTSDGTQVFGYSSRASGIDRMYRWTGPGTFQGLGIFGLAERIAVNAANAAGTVVVATASADQGSVYQGCVWTAQSGFRAIPGVGSFSEAVAVSSDGARIAGSRRGPDDHTQGYVWSQARGLEVLQPLSGSFSEADDMTADGSLIVGASSSQAGGRATLWANGVPSSLGVLDNFLDSRARSVSDDGSIVTGYCMTLTGPADPNRDEFVWTAAWGMLELHEFLGRYGLEVPAGLYLDRVKVTGDGRTLYASAFDGLGSQGTYVASIPSMGSAVVLTTGLLATRRRR